MIELGVIEPVEEVNRARTRCRQADADLAGILGVRAGHEGGHLLVPHLHELELLLEVGQPLIYPTEAVTRVAIHAVHAPLDHSLPEVMANGVAHIFWT